MPRHLTGYTALEYYGHLSNVPSRVIRERRGPLLEKVGLAARAKDPVRTYSKGMLQRLGLAQAMLQGLGCGLASSAVKRIFIALRIRATTWPKRPKPTMITGVCSSSMSSNCGCSWVREPNRS